MVVTQADAESDKPEGVGDEASGAHRTSKRGNRKEGDEHSAEHRKLLAPARRPGRRVIRIVRHVQLWSVFKVALLGGLVLYGIFLISLAVIWSLINAAGQIHHIEQFMRDIGFENWSFNGPQLFRGAAIIGAIGLIVSSIMLTLWAAVINLIAELTGGLRFTVIETDESDDD